ncbi:helix-turn-helix transcriptional regulator [Streptomyces alkaliphilus]|uniref:helix-turn-helix transcriptional regulator n=1 Tax=Streptomyces alkaliphilus TaxID=1472722 RepID=UPI0011813161|nr:DNA-binding response regulator [Streptomyces alkaliphilus]
MTAAAGTLATVPETEPSISPACCVPSGAGVPGSESRVRILSSRSTSPGDAPGAPDPLSAMLCRAGLVPVTEEDPDADTVVVVLAPTVEEALSRRPPGEHRALLVCDTVTPSGLRRAIRCGVPAVLCAAGLTPEQLGAAVRGARRGEGRLPYPPLARLLAAGDVPGPVELTPGQTRVLTLVADGYANADIARRIGCSEHTVKNTVHEVMGRLQARNRAHAVATAVRTGLV